MAQPSNAAFCRIGRPAVALTALVLPLLVGAAACSLASLDGYWGKGSSVDGGLDGAVDEAGNPLVEVEAGADAVAPQGGSIVFVQGKATFGMAKTVSAELDAPIGAHHALIIAFEFDNDVPLVSVKDSLGNTFDPIVGPVALSDQRAFIYAVYDAKAGADTVTVTVDALPTEFPLLVHEYDGIATTNAFDVENSTQGTTKAADGMALQLTTRADGELVFAFGYASTPTDVGTVVAGTNMTKRLTTPGTMTEDYILGVEGTTRPTATMTTGSGWVFLAATFKPR